MRVSQLQTSPTGFMFWDKDLGRYATIDDVKNFCEIAENVYGSDEELRLQCYGRFRKLAYTGTNDKNNRPLYEGHVVKIAYKIAGQKITFIGVIGFEKSEFVIVDTENVSTSLSAYDSCDLKLIGSIFTKPELMEVKKR